MNALTNGATRVFLLLATLTLGGCPLFGSGDPEPTTEPDTSEPPPATYSIGGTLSGLSGDDVEVFLSSKIPQQIVVGNGPFVFPEPVEDGTDFAVGVTRISLPVNPRQRCEADPAVAAGTVQGADITDIEIACVPAYTVGGSVSRLTGSGMELGLYVEGTYRTGLTIDTNGAFEISYSLLPGESYEVRIENMPQNPNQRCEIDRATDLMPNANVTTVSVDCAEPFVLGVSVSGLSGTGLELENTINDAFAIDPGKYPITDTLTIDADGDHEFALPLISGEDYSVVIKTSPTPSQHCKVLDGTGLVFSSDPEPVKVVCGDAKVSGTVSGLLGDEVGITLSTFADVNGSPAEFELQDLRIDANGDFEFDRTLDIGDEYLVRVFSHPQNPEQECFVLNESGVITGDVTDVEVVCSRFFRQWRFDDNFTIDTSDALRDGELENGVLDDDYLYSTGPAVPLGRVSGLDTSELFQLFLDGPGALGTIHSNKTGFTYWLAAESPSGTHVVDETVAATTVLSHYGALDTYWRVRKEGPNAVFKLHLTQVHMLAYDAGHNDRPPLYGELTALADLRVRGITPGITSALDEVFYDTHGEIALVGKRNDLDPSKTDWILERRIDPDALQELWETADFTLDDQIAGANGFPPDAAAYATLNETITIEVDLSDVAIGEEFIVLSEALIRAGNSYTREGGSAVFLRDPGEFQPGDEDVTARIEISDIAILDIGDPFPEKPVAGAGPTPQACDPSVTELSVLQFEGTAYSLSEDPEVPPFADIRITRSDSLDGLVSAVVRMQSGTAMDGEDFTSRDIPVRFGDQSDAPRTLTLPIVNDGDEEIAEMFTLTLESPEGCAVIGSNNTATITIVASDPSKGTIEFSADSFEIDEAAGTAMLTVNRNRGDTGVVSATVSTSDGTAVEGVDYAPVSTLLVFQDGDATPKTVPVPILDNTAQDGDRTVLLSITATDTSLLGPLSNAELTILDDDRPAAGTLQFRDASYAVDESAGFVSLSVSRDGGSSGAVSASVATSDGSATEPSDYLALQATIDFADGDTAPKTVDISIVDDGDDEGDHAFNVMLFDATGGATLGTPAAVPVVIIDDDGAPPAPPAAPSVSASAEPKLLVFDWQSVADASFYRFLMDPTGASGFAQVGGDIPLGETRYHLPVSVHLLDWANARFLLQACNSAGCTDSNEIDAEALMVTSIGFFKSSNSEGRQQLPTGNGDYFGWVLALSSDGRTLAVNAYNEDSNALYVNGDQTDNSATDSGAVYVFDDDGSGWLQQAYIKASNTGRRDRFGTAIAVSADGNTLAIGAPAESSFATGINGDQADNSMGAAGAVYVYVRSGGVWGLQAYLKASNTDAGDLFGTAVAISDDGNTLIVGAPEESSGATGVNGDQADNGVAEAGAAYLFTRSGSAWQQSAYIKASNTEAEDWFATAVAMSGDGDTIAVTALREDSAARSINGDQADNSAPGNGSTVTGTGAVYVFVNANGSWVQEAYVKSSNLDPDDKFGTSLSLSGDGNLLAVGAAFEDSIATGVDSPMENDNSEENVGAVYLFARSGSLWQQDGYFKASNSGRGHAFGHAVDLSEDGGYLVVGAYGEDSKSVGINGDQGQSVNIDIGAAYLFARDGLTGAWSQAAYIKASNSNYDRFGFGRELSFGQTLSISGNGSALAIGAYREPSSATGINGDQVNEDAFQSGAVYVY